MTEARFGIETVREAVRRKVSETSLRQVADEIPMSFSGLRSFLGGGRPQPVTRAKLVAWYSRHRGKRSKPSASDVERAITILALYIGQAVSAARERRVDEIVERIKRESDCLDRAD